MTIQKFAFSDIPQLSATDVAYQQGDSRLRPFYSHLPSLESFGEIIANRQFSRENREALVAALRQQYAGVESLALDQIDRLAAANTFTITTAHQPALLTGPLYFVYKICNAIQLCRKLAVEYPQYQFVPMYWMGGEDHDFEEVNHLHLFQKTLTWTDKQGGSVAKYSVDSLLPLLAECKEILGESPEALELKTLIDNSFRPEYNYGQAMFRFIDGLFARYGLLVLIPDALKKLMIPIFEDDLTVHSSQQKVSETVARLEAAGFRNQAYVRPINLFYLLPNKRERIELEAGRYKVLNSDLQFNQEEILAELKAYPERFSPNVILRPLFQETVLPNLAYIGGGGEIAYWLERKTQFEHFGVPFPMLIRRSSLQWIDRASLGKLEKLGLQPIDLFQESESLIKYYLAQHSSAELSLDEERQALSLVFQKIIAKTTAIDGSLEASVSAQQAQLFNALEKLETRLLRSEKQKQETELNQIRKLQEKLGLPNGLQERKENFMGLYLRYGASFFDTLLAVAQPLEKEFLLVLED